MQNTVPHPEPTPRSAARIFSQRLEDFMDLLWDGKAPNAGEFCAFCYNPIPRGYVRCDHCGQDLAERPPLKSLPREIVYMYRSKMKRESTIVNGFAFLGLFLGLALFLGMVAINVLYMEKAFWFFCVSIVVLIVASRVFAGLIGGVIGDEVGYRVASNRLAEDWATWVHERETAAKPGEPSPDSVKT
jgi:hypothetical protein